MSNALAIRGPAQSVEVAAEARLRRETLLESAALVIAVTDSFTLEDAYEQERALKQYAADVEEARVAVKAQPMALCRQIDTLAKEHVEKVQTEARRINSLSSAYNAEQRRKQAEAEAKRQAELKRIDDERRAAELEANRKAEAELAKAKSESDREAARLRAIQAAAGAEREAKQKAETLATVALPLPTVKGASVREVWTYEVTDTHALYASRRDLVGLIPKAREINAAIVSGLRECPGLRIYSETETRVRK